jgi:ferric-dicitrate binding protein FerR (iron transport regulator)
MAYRPTHETECCSGTVNRMLPNFLSRMWMTDSDGGAVATIYGPSTATFPTAQGNIVITCSTEYHFAETLTFNVSGDEGATLPLTLRIPTWCSNASAALNDSPIDVALTAGTFVKLPKAVKRGDVVTLTLPMTIEKKTLEGQGVCFQRGPLLYAYAIPQQKTEDTEEYDCMHGKKPENPDFKCWNITPTGAFNYAFADDGQPVSVSSEEGIAKAQAVNTHHSTTASQDRTVTTHHDSEFWMTLEDGTRVHLNYGTQLTYPIHFSGDTREVELQGEAYFFVAKDKSRPFIVHTPNGDVRQYGTEFNINTRDEIGATRVVLVNGSIGITPRGGTESMMRPNDMAILQPGEAEPMISQVDIMPYIAWNTGTFVFDDCTLEQLMRVLGHWYNKRVEFNDDAIREMRFTGEIDKYESILPTMKAIHKVTGLRIEVRGKEIIISE